MNITSKKKITHYKILTLFVTVEVKADVRTVWYVS